MVLTSMNYGDSIKLLATDGEETRRFKLQRSGAANSGGYMLYGYNPDKNALSLLEDFSINGHPSRSAVVREAKNQIQFYTGDSWTIEPPEQQDTTMTDPTEEAQQSIELDPETVVYGSRNLEIGVTEGGDNGYVEFETPVGEEFRLTILRSEVEQFAETLSQRSKPFPTPPEGAPTEVDAPDGWTAGTRHTGGGIWCIIFEKQMEPDGRVEVVTDAARPAGVSAGCYDEEGAWVGELTHEDFESADYEKALATARTLIDKIEDGEFDETIAELLG